MVLLNYYNDNNVENTLSFISNNSNSYINGISDANINDKNKNVNNENGYSNDTVTTLIIHAIHTITVHRFYHRIAIKYVLNLFKEI